MKSAVDLSQLAVAGTILRVRATPGARQAGLSRDTEGTIHVRVTVVAEDGKANAEIVRALAAALGIAPSRLLLEKGAKGRDKVFRITT